VGLVLGPVDLVLPLVDPVDRVDPMDRADLVGRAVLHLVGLRDLPHPGDRVDLMDRAVLVGPVVLLLVDPGDREDLMVLLDRAVLGLVVLLLVDPVDREALMARAGLGDLASRVVLVGMDPAAPADLVRMRLADRVELMSRVVPADLAVLAAPAVPDLTDRVGLAGLAAPVDRHRRRTSNTVSMTGVAPRWAAPGTCPTGSVRRITGRRLRPGSTDSAGTVGLPPVLRRLSGTDHRLQAVGAGLRLPVVGTAHGTGRRAMSQSRSVISGRLVTAGTTRSRCSTRYSVDGASGSSVSGSRCTDLTAPSPD
jgi:hypothetical protein